MIERRRRRRIVTLKNFGWLMLAFLIAFIGLSFDRGFNANGYGRIVDSEIAPVDDIKPKPQPIVTEAPSPIADQNGADPLLLAPAAREQEFLSTSTAPPPVINAAQVTPIQTRGSGVNVVGDSSGITIVRGSDAPKPPVLSGGIFKQP